MLPRPLACLAPLALALSLSLSRSRSRSALTRFGLSLHPDRQTCRPPSRHREFLRRPAIPFAFVRGRPRGRAAAHPRGGQGGAGGVLAEAAGAVVSRA